jgi:hypothetical protein
VPDLLRVSDVPVGFYLAGRSRLTPAQAAATQALVPAAFLGHGGGASPSERFVLRLPATVGLTFIAAQLIAFRTVAGTIWGFGALRAALAHSGTIGTVQRSVNILATATALPSIIKIIKHPVPPLIAPYAAEHVLPVGTAVAAFRNTSAACAGEFVFDNVRRG